MYLEKFINNTDKKPKTVHSIYLVLKSGLDYAIKKIIFQLTMLLVLNYLLWLNLKLII